MRILNYFCVKKVIVMSIITLLTDLGESEYQAIMKGVILKINPSVKIIDITHSIPPQNILEGAFILENSVKFFPEGTVHIGVVDPGVGSIRKPLAIKCETGILIGPDNGLLLSAARAMGLENIYELTNRHMFLPEVSETFHGRDIFAPVAAELAKDPEKISEAGEIYNSPPVELEVASPEVDTDCIRGTIMHIDSFGNLITNVSSSKLGTVLTELREIKEMELHIKDKFALLRFYNNYAEAEFRQFIALLSSSGHLELAKVGNSAANQLGVKVGDKFKLLL